MPGLFLSDNLERRYGGVLSNGLYNLEVTNDIVTVRSADDESRLDLCVGIFEVYILCEVCFAELLVVDNVSGVILDDQGEFFACGVVEDDLEDDLIVGGAYVLN